MVGAVKKGAEDMRKYKYEFKRLLHEDAYELEQMIKRHEFEGWKENGMIGLYKGKYDIEMRRPVVCSGRKQEK